MHMQITKGLRRLGHDAYYFEMTSTWPFDPIRHIKVDNDKYAIPYLGTSGGELRFEGSLGSSAQLFR